MPETMKRLFLLSIICIFCTVQGFSMSYAEARENAYFLTDKMAYELDLTPQQYDVVYSINLDYFMSLRPTSNLRGTYWRYREQDLRYVLFDWQYSLYRTLDYFLYPVRWIYGSWYYPVTVVYRTGYYYYGHPGPYYTYGGHHWKERGRYPNGRYYGVSIARGEGMRSRYDASYHRGGRPAPPPGHAGSHNNHGKPNGSHDNHGIRPGHDNHGKPNGSGHDNHGTRPGNDNHGTRPGHDNHGTRPGNDNHGTRPGNDNNGSRPSSSTRPSSGSSNPTISGGTYRPGRGSSTTGNSGSSRSSSKWSTSTRPTNVSTGSSTRPTSGSSTRPSSGSSTRPSSTGSFRGGRSSSSSVKSSSSSRSSAGSRSSSVRSSVRSGR